MTEIMQVLILWCITTKVLEYVPSLTAEHPSMKICMHLREQFPGTEVVKISLRWTAVSKLIR